MGSEFFHEGGPYKIRRTGPETYTFNIGLPIDSDGLIGRECPSSECSPAYFKIRLGTGVTGAYKVAYCPYCRTSADPANFHTKAQLEYGKQIVAREAALGAERMIKDALELGPSGKRKIGGGFLSMEISLKPSHRLPVFKPAGLELRRDITCPNCGLDHAVFGIATWCPDCGTDIFLTHVAKEYEVVRKMLTDVDNRRERLGNRVAARDIENALEDTVSTFEAVFRAMTRRKLLLSHSEEETAEILKRRIANKFQSVESARETAQRELAISGFESLNDDEFDNLKLTFEKRHPITHNLGVVDRKYLERAASGELQGREIRVTVDEVSQAVDLCLKVICSAYTRVFPASRDNDV